jgi:cell division protein FtsQ
MPWFGKKSGKRSGQRSRILKRRTLTAERLIFWFKRGGIVFGLLIFTGWLGSWFFLSGASGKLANWVHGEVLEVTADAGLKVRNILVEGRQFTDADAIMAIVNIRKNDPLYAFQPEAAREMIEKLSWVKSARVERRLPDTIYIKLEERTPMALWQKGKKLTLIDTMGVSVTDQKLERFEGLMILVGDDAPQEAPSFFKLLEAEPELWKRVDAAKLVSGRRWDLKLKNGVEVKLPEEELTVALRRLAVLQEEDQLMDKDIMTIDVREPERVTIRTKPGAVQEYKASYQQIL